MKDAGSALMGIGRASGDNRAVEAARQAIASPLLEINIAGAQGILYNITGSSSLGLLEVTEAAEEIRAAADPEANIIFGTSFNERLGDEIMITVIATGFNGTRRQQPIRREQPVAAVPVYQPQAPVRQPYAEDVQRATPAPARQNDFLDTLDRERTQLAEPAAPEQPIRRYESPFRPERTPVEPVPIKRTSYDSDSLEIPDRKSTRRNSSH